MNLNSAYGRLFLRTLSVFWSHTMTVRFKSSIDDIVIMTLSQHDDDHPFEYARVIGIFHVDVIHGVEGATQHPVSKEVLWVRRFRRDKSYRAGFKQKCLHRLEFLSSADDSAFGFLDPDEVICASHLIPAFCYGVTNKFLSGESFGSAPDELDDYRYFYINMCSIFFF